MIQPRAAGAGYENAAGDCPARPRADRSGYSIAPGNREIAACNIGPADAGTAAGAQGRRRRRRARAGPVRRRAPIVEIGSGVGLGDQVEIGDDPRLAGVDHVAALVGAAEYLAVDETHPAGRRRCRCGNREAARRRSSARRRAGDRRSWRRNVSLLKVTLQIFVITPPQCEWVGHAAYARSGCDRRPRHA